MQDLELPELSTDQMELLCNTVEEAARNYVFSKVSRKETDRLDVIVEAEGGKPLNLHVEVDLALSANFADVDSKAIVEGAIKEAFKAGEKFLRKIA